MQPCLSDEEGGSKRKGEMGGGRTSKVRSLGRPSIYFGVREGTALRN